MKTALTPLPEGGWHQETIDPEGDKLRINGFSYLDLWGMRQIESPLKAEIPKPIKCRALEKALKEMEKIGMMKCRKS